MGKKYKLTEETINVYGRTLHRIESLRDFGNVKKGDKGGFIENEDNLSQWDDCWVYDNAKVYNDAVVYDNAMVFKNAMVYGNACVFGDAEIYDNVRVYGNAEVFGNVHIKGDADISSISDYIFFKNWWSSGRCFTWTRSNNMWSVGCFYGTGEELIAKAYKDSEISGKEYELVVKYVESILKDGNTTTIVNKIKQRLIKIIKKFNL